MEVEGGWWARGGGGGRWAWGEGVEGSGEGGGGELLERKEGRKEGSGGWGRVGRGGEGGGCREVTWPEGSFLYLFFAFFRVTLNVDIIVRVSVFVVC